MNIFGKIFMLGNAEFTKRPLLIEQTVVVNNVVNIPSRKKY